MKKLFAIAGALLLSMSTYAQNDNNVFTHFGGSIGLGTTGITIDLSTNITDYVGVRAGIDYMPKYKYATDVSITGLNEKQGQYNAIRNANPQLNLPAVTFPNKVDIEGKLNNTTGHLLFDFYPGKKIDWHLTLGAYFGPSEVLSVYTTNDNQLLGVYQYNNSAARTMAGFPKIGVELGDYFLEPDANGHIDACMKVNSFRPYVGLGWGRGVPKNHTLGFSVDLGVQFWGKPEVYLQGDKMEKGNFDNEDGGIVKDLIDISIYPTLTFRLTGKFF
jgi:hypothetical protein